MKISDTKRLNKLQALAKADGHGLWFYVSMDGTIQLGSSALAGSRKTIRQAIDAAIRAERRKSKATPQAPRP